jgi:hypothetical protein
MLTLTSFLSLAHAQIVSNGSFELPNIPDNSHEYIPVAPAWTFTRGAGIIDPLSAFVSPPAPDGEQVGFIQENNPETPLASFEQSLILPATGVYVLSYLEAGRPIAGAATGNLTYDIFLDNTLIHTDTTFSNQVFTPVLVNFIGAAGSHTLKFEESLIQVAGDQTGFFDQIQITAVPEPTTAAVLAAPLFFLLSRRRR